MHTIETLTTLTRTVLTSKLPELEVTLEEHRHSPTRTSTYLRLRAPDGFTYSVTFNDDGYGKLSVLGERPNYRYRRVRRQPVLRVRKDGSFNFDALVEAVNAKHDARIARAIADAKSNAGMESSAVEFTALHDQLGVSQPEAETFSSFRIGDLYVNVSLDDGGKLAVRVEGNYALTGDEAAKLIKQLRQLDASPL